MKDKGHQEYQGQKEGSKTLEDQELNGESRQNKRPRDIKGKADKTDKIEDKRQKKKEISKKDKQKDKGKRKDQKQKKIKRNIKDKERIKDEMSKIINKTED